MGSCYLIMSGVSVSVTSKEAAEKGLQKMVTEVRNGAKGRGITGKREWEEQGIGRVSFRLDLSSSGRSGVFLHSCSMLTAVEVFKTSY